MGRIIFSAIASLDGFIDDADGGYDWAMPGEDLIGFLNDEMAGVGTFLYGRRMYEEMSVWETDASVAADSPESARFAAWWNAADKVVFSRTLAGVTTRRTRLEHHFDAELVRRIAAEAPGDLTVEGPTLAAHAFRLGLVDEVQRMTAPVIVGGGTALFPPGLRLDLHLVEERRFKHGITFARYTVRH